VRGIVEAALDVDHLRRMPNKYLPGGQEGGHVLLGDAWNMRRPLTGGV
jgi:hypothetical protein